MKKPRGVKKNFTWSYTRATEFDKCPLAYNLTVNRKEFELPKPPSNAALRRGIEIHQGAEEYVGGYIEMPEALSKFRLQFETLKDNEHTVTEENWWFDRDWKRIRYQDWDNVWLMIKADAHLLMPDVSDRDKTLDVLLLIDYKTGNQYTSHIQQSELYAIAGMSVYGKAITRVESELWYLDSGDVLCFEYDIEFLEEQKEVWIKKMNRIEKVKLFEPSPSAKSCKWCNFHQRKGGPCKHGVY